jgi:16S rRNA (guanine(1405)-N(7))-methyltransferase
MITVDEQQVRELVDTVGKKSAYRAMQIPETMLRDLAVKALERQPSTRTALKTVRRKLHQITAPYLGDPDYENATRNLQAAFLADDPIAVQNCCREIMASHASTRERLQILGDFYQRLFDEHDKPAMLLDLACGLNPLSWRWMGLPAGTCYRVYDIHAPRVAFLNEYFRLEGIDGEAILSDILVTPPNEKADAAFLFKEAHRFEERESGCNRALWRALNVKTLYVSLPPFSLTGRHDLMAKNRKLVTESIAGEEWRVREISFSNEQVFVIEK